MKHKTRRDETCLCSPTVLAWNIGLLGSNFDETYFDYRRIHEIGNLRQFIARHR